MENTQPVGVLSGEGRHRLVGRHHRGVEYQGACDGNAVTLDPEVITTRGTLSAITQTALKRTL